MSYITLKPVSRLTVIVAKLLASTLITTVLVEVALTATYFLGTQGTGDTQFRGFGLAFHATAGCVDLYVVFIETFYRFQGQLDLVLQVYEGEILFVVLVIDRDLAVAPGKEHPGYSLFTATNCIFLLFHLSEKLEG